MRAVVETVINSSVDFLSKRMTAASGYEILIFGSLMADDPGLLAALAFR
jgi:hypothetical protein